MQKTHFASFGACIVASVLGASFASAQERPTLTFEYDENGNLTLTRDALGRVTRQNYDALDRVRSVSRPKPAPTSERPVIRFRYDGRDQPTAVVDPRNLTTSYAVSGLGELTRQTSPDTGVTRSTYDAAGNLKTRRDARGKTTVYTYDSIDRLVRADYADGTSTILTYDEGPNGIGRLTRMVDAGPITTTWTYNAQGQVAGKSQIVAAGGIDRTHTIQYGYNGTTGQLNSMVYPSGRVIAYQYGAVSRQIEAVTIDGQPVASNVTYHGFSGLKSMQLANGLTWASTVDQDGRVTGYTLGGVAYSILWDRANRITAITHATLAYWSSGYAYDGLDRIASFISEPRDQTFNYDATGNLLSKMDRVGTNDPITYTYSIDPASNRMVGISNLGIGYTIDAAGNRTADSTTTWVVDARGRVKQVRVINGALTDTYNYLINGHGLRVRKRGPSAIVPQGTRVYVYDEAGRLIGEYDNLGRARSEHVWLDDRPIALISYTYSGSATTPNSMSTYSVETDHLGTPRLITDATQIERWHWHSAPYGDTRPNENPSNKGDLVYNLRFPGQYFDIETGAHYNWHRDFEATTGRYLESDPLGLGGGINTYAYVGGDPLSYIDPLGLAGCFVNFPDFPITVPGTSWQTTLTPGHAGALGYDSAAGATRYYEYGRYDSDFGDVRRQPVPDLKIGKDGQPTPESMKALQEALSRNAGKGTRAELTCEKDIDEKKMYEYAEKLKRDANRPPYSWKPWASNTCRDFARRALDAGRP